MEILSYTFFQNALVGLLLVSVVAAVAGTYVVARRMMFVAGGITHASFGGLGLGYFLGMNPLPVAGLFAVGASLGVEWLSTRQRVREDSAISVVWALGMALGILFIFLTPGYVPELQSFLFGNILTITTIDLVVFAAFAILLLAVVIVLFRPIEVCAFDSDFARTAGIPVTAINGMMTVLVAVGIVLTLKLIGIMMLLSLFALPPMIAEQFACKLRPMMLLSAVISMVGSIIGLLVAYFTNIPASATIVLTLIVAYAVVRLSHR